MCWNRSVACFPDVRVVSCSDDRTVRVWDLAAQTCLRTLRGHTGAVNQVITLMDGRVASCSEDGTVRMWDTGKTSANESATVLKGHEGAVLCIAEAHSTTILSGSSDETIKLWNHRSKYCLMTLVGHSGRVCSVALLPNGMIASGSLDCTVKVWDIPEERYFSQARPLEDGRGGKDVLGPMLSLNGHRSSITSVISLDADHIVTSSADKLIAVWSIVSGRCITVLSGHDEAVTAVIRLVDGRLASCSTDIKLWDIGLGDKKGSRAALTERFNTRNDRFRIGGKLQENRSKLWGGVRSMFHSGEDVAAADPAPAYPLLSTAYPSTIGMFAASYVPAGTDGDFPPDEEKAMRRLMSVMFSQVGDVAPLSDLKLRVHDWKQRLRRRKGPNMVDWFGIDRGKRIRKALVRLSELCDSKDKKRVTYHRVKESLIEEFGEDLFTQMKEQVTMELAMRDFMLAGGRGVGDDGETPETSPIKGAKRTPKFFPETGTPAHSGNIERGAVDYEDDEDDTIYVTAPNTNLAEIFAQIAEDSVVQTEEERVLGNKLDDLTAEFEAGRAQPETPNYEPEDDGSWLAKAMEQSTLLWREDMQDDKDPPTLEPAEHAEEEEVEVEVFNVDNFKFRGAIWA